MSIVVGVTGASGSLYGRRLLEILSREDRVCHLVVSAAGEAVSLHELGESPFSWHEGFPGGSKIVPWDINDLFAPFCSGSNPPQAMIVAPCSMGTLARIAAGTSDSLLTRAADVCLKERTPLILVVRETPLSLIHIENMARVARAGGVILPASPGFYHHPADLSAIVDHVVGRILDVLKIPHDLFPPWEKPSREGPP